MDIFVLDNKITGLYLFIFFGKKMTLFAKGRRNTEVHEIC